MVKSSALTSRSQPSQAYAALLLFPALHQLRFEPSLKVLKKIWNIAVPKYCSFYECRILPKTLMTTDTAVSEEALRLWAATTMRILPLFHGANLARTPREIKKESAVYFISPRRKERSVHQRYTVHKLRSSPVCPQNALDAYLAPPADYDSPELCVSLPKLRHPLTSDKINAISTNFRKAHEPQGAAGILLCRHPAARAFLLPNFPAGNTPLANFCRPQCASATRFANGPAHGHS